MILQRKKYENLKLLVFQGFLKEMLENNSNLKHQRPSESIRVEVDFHRIDVDGHAFDDLLRKSIAITAKRTANEALFNKLQRCSNKSKNAIKLVLFTFQMLQILQKSANKWENVTRLVVAFEFSSENEKNTSKRSNCPWVVHHSPVRRRPRFRRWTENSKIFFIGIQIISKKKNHYAFLLRK